MQPSIRDMRAKLPEMVERVLQGTGVTLQKHYVKQGIVNLVSPEVHEGSYILIIREQDGGWYVREGDKKKYVYRYTTGGGQSEGADGKPLIGGRVTFWGNLTSFPLSSLGDNLATELFLALERFERAGGYTPEPATDPTGVVRLLLEREQKRASEGIAPTSAMKGRKGRVMGSDAVLSSCEEVAAAVPGAVLHLPRYLIVGPGGRVEYCDEALRFTVVGEDIFACGGDRYRLVDLPANRRPRGYTAYDFWLVRCGGG